MHPRELTAKTAKRLLQPSERRRHRGRETGALRQNPKHQRASVTEVVSAVYAAAMEANAAGLCVLPSENGEKRSCPNGNDRWVVPPALKWRAA